MLPCASIVAGTTRSRAPVRELRDEVTAAGGDQLDDHRQPVRHLRGDLQPRILTRKSWIRGRFASNQAAWDASAFQAVSRFADTFTICDRVVTVFRVRTPYSLGRPPNGRSQGS